MAKKCNIIPNMFKYFKGSNPEETHNAVRALSDLSMGIMHKLYTGGSKFLKDDWIQGMVKELGQDVTPHLEVIWKNTNALYSKVATRNKELSVYGDPMKLFGYSTNRMIPISEAEHNMMLMTKKEMKLDPGIFNTSQHIIEKIDKTLGTNFTSLIRHELETSASNRVKESLAIKKSVEALIKENNLKHDDLVNISLNSILLQENGADILGKMGYDIGEIPPMTPEQNRLYDHFRNHFQSLFVRLNEARSIAGAEPLKAVDNYFTFARILTEAEFKGFDLTRITNRMYSKLYETHFPYDIRYKSDLPLKLNPVKVFEQYLDTSLKYIHFTPTIVKARGLIDYTWEVPSSKTNKQGKPYMRKENLAMTNPSVYGYLHNYLNDAAGLKEVQQLMRSNSLYRGAVKLVNNISKSVLGYNPSTIIKQLPAAWNTLAEVGPSHMIKAMNQYLDPKIRKQWENESEILLVRSPDIAYQDLGEIYLASAEFKDGIKGKVSDIVKTIGAYGYKPIEMLDMISAKWTYGAAKSYAMDKLGYDNKSAVRYADDMVLKYQGSANTIHISEAQKSIVGRLLTQFNTFSIARWSMYKNEMIKPLIDPKSTKEERSKAFSMAMRYVIATTLTGAIYRGFMGISSPEPSPFLVPIMGDSEEPIKEMATEAASIFPVFGNAVKVPGSAFGASGSLLYDLFTAVSRTSDKGHGKFPKMEYAKVAAKVSGIPGSSAALNIIDRVNKDNRSPMATVFGGEKKKKKSLGDYSYTYK